MGGLEKAKTPLRNVKIVTNTQINKQTKKKQFLECEQNFKKLSKVLPLRKSSREEVSCGGSLGLTLSPVSVKRKKTD